jgi:hypothetical protein
MKATAEIVREKSWDGLGELDEEFAQSLSADVLVHGMERLVGIDDASVEQKVELGKDGKSGASEGAKMAPHRECPIRWALDGSGQIEARSSDRVTWYRFSVSSDGQLRCSCMGFKSHGHCYHVPNAAYALEVWISCRTRGQLMFWDGTYFDATRLALRRELRELKSRFLASACHGAKRSSDGVEAAKAAPASEERA